MDHQIYAEKLKLELNNKKKRICHLVDFAIPADLRMNVKESKKLKQIPGPCQRTGKAVESEGDDDTNHSQIFWNSP